MGWQTGASNNVAIIQIADHIDRNTRLLVPIYAPINSVPNCCTQGVLLFLFGLWPVVINDLTQALIAPTLLSLVITVFMGGLSLFKEMRARIY